MVHRNNCLDYERVKTALLQLEKCPGKEEEGIGMAIAKHVAAQTIPGYIFRLQWPGTMFPVVCKKSRVHGKGVFATRDIREGEVLTLYPPDMVSIYNGDNTWMSFETGNAKRQKPLRVLLDRYSFKLGEEENIDNVQIIGYPELDQGSTYLGHMINDAAGPCEREEQYWARALKRVNALPKRVHSGAHFMYTATRDIPKGSEVLTAYGPDYWRAVKANAALVRASPTPAAL